MNKKILFSILTLLGVCACAMVLIIGVVIFAARSSEFASFPGLNKISPTALPVQSAERKPLDTPLPPVARVEAPSVALGSTQPTPIPPPPALAAQMDDIQQNVISLRGLQPHNAITRALISPADLQKKVETDFFKDYSDEDARDDTLVLSAFGLLPRDYPLRNFYLDLYSEQIAGFYDNETKEMYVVQGAKFGGIERMTYAHEFTHNLQDQVYDLKKGLKLDDDYCKTQTEYCSAVTALVEGDASLTESRWLFEYATKQDRQDIQSFYSNYSSPVYDSAPQYMQKDFVFPYSQGLEFVNSLVDRGGYAMVDEAFRNPPVTTEQILHPDKYPLEKPAVVNLPGLTDTLGDGWKLIDQNELGEWYTFLVLSNGEGENYRLSEDISRTAAAGWGGDAYAIYSRESDGAFVLVLHSRWDTEKDSKEFYSAFQQYAGFRWGEPTRQSDTQTVWNSTGDGGVIVERNGLDTIWLITPDETIQQEALDIIQALQPAR